MNEANARVALAEELIRRQREGAKTVEFSELTSWFDAIEKAREPRTVDFTDHVNVAPDGRPGWRRIALGQLNGQFVVVWERGSSE